MAKLLIMCEGNNELTIVNLLLDADRFLFTRNDLLGLVPYHARQIKSSSIVRLALEQYNNKVEVLRIGDILSDLLVIPDEYLSLISSVSKFCTKPELEILLIINEGRYNEYTKLKAGSHKISPKSFCKANIIYGHTQYDNSSDFYRRYYGKRIDLLVNNIKTYHQLQKAHRKDEYYLASLLK